VCKSLLGSRLCRPAETHPRHRCTFQCSRASFPIECDEKRPSGSRPFLQPWVAAEALAEFLLFTIARCPVRCVRRHRKLLFRQVAGFEQLYSVIFLAPIRVSLLATMGFAPDRKLQPQTIFEPSDQIPRPSEPIRF